MNLFLSFTLFISALMFFPSIALSEKDEQNRRFLLGSFRNNKEGASQPIYIKSDSLEVDSKKGVFRYIGNVEMIQGDLQITSEVLSGIYGGKEKKTQEIEKIICSGQVVITKGTGMRASSNKAVFKVKEEIVELTEAPELYRDGNILSADILRIFIAKDTSEAEGNVRVKVVNTKDRPVNSDLFVPIEAEGTIELEGPIEPEGVIESDE